MGRQNKQSTPDKKRKGKCGRDRKKYTIFNNEPDDSDTESDPKSGSALYDIYSQKNHGRTTTS
jgi:hypothetical protein